MAVAFCRRVDRRGQRKDRMHTRSSKKEANCMLRFNPCELHVYLPLKLHEKGIYVVAVHMGIADDVHKVSNLRIKPET